MRYCIERSLVHSAYDDSGGEFSFSYSASESVFAGHFPGTPILPGVFQIEMTRLASELATGQTLEIEHIKQARFLCPILPESEVHLSLAVQCDHNTCHAKSVVSVAGVAAGKLSIILHSV